MLMEHHHSQGRPSWTSSLYPASTMASGTVNTASSSITYDALRPPAYPTETAAYQQQYPQEQENSYRYSYEPSRPAAFAPLPPPPRDDALPPSRLPFPAPGLPRPMIGGSLSPHLKTGIPMPGMATPAFTIPKPGGPTTPKRATDEERRAKHREAQRRFVKRKKIEMMQLKQLAVELEKRHDLLQVVSEREALTRENEALQQQLETQKQKAQEAQESPTTTSQPVDEEEKKDVKQEISDDQNKENQQKNEDQPRPEIQWETRTFEW